MYDPTADARAGLHNPTGEPGCEFEVFRANDHPDLGLPEGWWWDLPQTRADTATTPRIDGMHQYANGPFPTSTAAFEHAMRNDGGMMN